jgi:uncharacterized protein (TIGR03437 family)
MNYTSDGQILAILPSNTPTGAGTMTVTYNGLTSSTAPVTVAANSPGLFTRNEQGSGPGVVQDSEANYNSFINAFHPGQTVGFWATGLGPISGSDGVSPPLGNLPGITVTALIGGQHATVTYAGRSVYPGVDQINVTIPDGVTGCFVPVGIFVNGIAANFVSMAVSTSGPICSDPNIMSPTQVQTAAGGNSVSIGTMVLTQFTATGKVLGLPLSVTNETGKSFYQQYTQSNFLNSMTPLSALAVSPGGCSVFQYTTGDFFDPAPATGLDAGSGINVTSGGTGQTLANTAAGQYLGNFADRNSALFLPPSGSVTVDNGSGGANVGTYSFTATLPPAITWTNKPSSTAISRNQDLSITWSGGDPTSVVYVLGQSPISSDARTGAEFVCVVQNSAGGLTVPALILSALPVSVNVTTAVGVNIPGGVMVVNSTTITPQSAPGLDLFLVGSSIGDGIAAFAFQ